MACVLSLSSIQNLSKKIHKKTRKTINDDNDDDDDMREGVKRRDRVEH